MGKTCSVLMIYPGTEHRLTNQVCGRRRDPQAAHHWGGGGGWVCTYAITAGAVGSSDMIKHLPLPRFAAGRNYILERPV